MKVVNDWLSDHLSVWNDFIECNSFIWMYAAILATSFFDFWFFIGVFTMTYIFSLSSVYGVRVSLHSGWVLMVCDGEDYNFKVMKPLKDGGFTYRIFSSSEEATEWFLANDIKKWEVVG